MKFLFQDGPCRRNIQWTPCTLLCTIHEDVAKNGIRLKKWVHFCCIYRLDTDQSSKANIQDAIARLYVHWSLVGFLKIIKKYPSTPCGKTIEVLGISFINSFG